MTLKKEDSAQQGIDVLDNTTGAFTNVSAEQYLEMIRVPRGAMPKIVDDMVTVIISEGNYSKGELTPIYCLVAPNKETVNYMMDLLTPLLPSGVTINVIDSPDIKENGVTPDNDYLAVLDRTNLKNATFWLNT